METLMFNRQSRESDNKEAADNKSGTATPVPAISLPKGGGAIRGIGEKFGANPVTGTGTMTVPIVTSPGRSGFGPQLGLSYDSGAGNGPFGLGWSLSLPAITRRTDKGLPKYQDSDESDVFILSGAEDLVPVLRHRALEQSEERRHLLALDLQRQRHHLLRQNPGKPHFRSRGFQPHLQLADLP